MGNIAENEEFLSLCVNLFGEERQTIRSRAEFCSKMDPESLGHYLPSGSQEVTSAHLGALLTDLPVRWLFDCVTNRRGTLRPK